MHVLLVNGSPHAHGCTYTALAEVAKMLEKEGISTSIFQIGTKPLSGCLACGRCEELKKCVLDDTVNEFIDLAKDADGFVFGSPVHYAAPSGSIVSFMHRVFFAGNRISPAVFAHKPAAAVVSARRAGTTAALDQLHKYFTLSQMPLVSSTYWPMVHGNTPEEVAQDEEGLQVMRNLGRNMAWLIKSIAVAKQHGVTHPEGEARVSTNFIR